MQAPTSTPGGPADAVRGLGPLRPVAVVAAVDEVGAFEEQGCSTRDWGSLEGEGVGLVCLRCEVWWVYENYSSEGFYN